VGENVAISTRFYRTMGDPEKNILTPTKADYVITFSSVQLISDLCLLWNLFLPCVLIQLNCGLYVVDWWVVAGANPSVALGSFTADDNHSQTPRRTVTVFWQVCQLASLFVLFCAISLSTPESIVNLFSLSTDLSYNIPH